VILTRRQKTTIAVLMPYWITLAILAHIPIPELVYRAHVSDKWLHFLAYLNLAFLLWFSINPDRKVSWRSRVAWMIFLITAVYGGLDEMVQPYVGRTADIGDFLANVAGVLSGLIIFAFLTFWQALLATTAITIFGLTNLAKADLSKLVPVLNAAFHIIAYAGFTIVWVRFMNLYLSVRSFVGRLMLTLAVPIVFLAIVKTSSLLLGRSFAPTDLLFSVLGIFGVTVVACLARMRAGR